MKCIGKKCNYCYNADFHDSCYSCASQNKTFLKESYQNHNCTILLEIEIAEKQLSSKKKMAEYIQLQQNN